MNNNINIKVINPRRLNNWEISCERIPLGEPGDYKPTIAVLPDGELVMLAFYGEFLPDNKYREKTVLWRSGDGGSSWSERRVVEDMIGREQWLTCISDGTLFATSHLLEMDINNQDGYCHSYVHRSTDRGESWERTKIIVTTEERSRANPDYGHDMTSTSRNIVELTNGDLLLGVSVGSSDSAWLWKSKDKGCTWEKTPAVKITGYYDNVDGFFAEDFTYRNTAGKMIHFVRVGPPSPMYPIKDNRIVPKTNDQGDRTMVCESYDEGRTWINLKNFGDYGVMYPRVFRLKDGRLILTYTQRGIFYPIGLRAILSYDDGETWDFETDLIIIEGKTPWGIVSGGGFGNTVQLPDGTLVSCYTYNGYDNSRHLEVVRWTL